MKLSTRVSTLHESATLAVTAKAARMRAAGVDVVSFGAGEPDFDTPAHIKQAAKEALDRGETKYPSPSSGLAVAKQAVCTKFLRDNRISYAPAQVIITTGSKMAINLAFHAVLDPGDEVIVPVPYWVSFPEIIRLADGVPVFLPGAESRDFRVTAEQIEDALTERTRVVLLNYPSNPGGFTYEPDEIRAIADVLSHHDVLVFSDEMYDVLVYEGRKHLSFAAVSPRAFEQTVTFNGGSKAYAMTGWRIGYAAGPQPIIDGMAKLQSQSTSGAATFTQIALAAALTGDQACVAEMREQFARRGAHMHRRLTGISGIHCVRPTAAFYVFPNVSALYPRIGVKDSVEFAERLLERAKVAVVPGAAFGSDDHVRLSFATSLEQIDRGLDRLAEFIAAH
ncbi:MAG TPA: pyridoxal phosphate-dependent aminotransferase [Phycisphaerae bacterium]